LLLSFQYVRNPQSLPSFPTRRSSDLSRQNDGNCQPEHDATGAMFTKERGVGVNPACAKYTSHSESEKLKKPERFLEFLWPFHPIDRKSTRLNSSHVSISYAVFCLKKK